MSSSGTAILGTMPEDGVGLLDAGVRRSAALAARNGSRLGVLDGKTLARKARAGAARERGRREREGDRAIKKMKMDTVG